MGTTIENSVSQVPRNLHPKRHIDPFGHFCTLKPHNRQIAGSSIAIGCISCIWHSSARWQKQTDNNANWMLSLRSHRWVCLRLWPQSIAAYVTCDYLGGFCSWRRHVCVASVIKKQIIPWEELPERKGRLLAERRGNMGEWQICRWHHHQIADCVLCLYKWADT